MPPRRGALGRGLDALFTPTTPAPPADETAEAPGSRAAEAGQAATQSTEPPGQPEQAGQVERQVQAAQQAPLEVELGRIEPNPLQPRKQMDPEQLADLADSIRAHGLLQPLVVTELPAAGGSGEPGEPGEPGESGGARRPRYQLVAGERRWQASKLAGLVRVPVVVREAAGRELLELALVENVQRADLNPLEEAHAYQQLASEFGLTQEEIGRRVGKSRMAVSNTQRLLQLPAVVQQAVLDGQLTEGHARALLGLADRDEQRQLAGEVATRGLSVRQTEELVRRMQARHAAAAAESAESDEEPAVAEHPGRREAAGEANGAGVSGVVAAELAAIEERFRVLLGTKVDLTHSRRGGRLVIHFYDEEQLMDLYERLGGAEED